MRASLLAVFAKAGLKPPQLRRWRVGEVSLNVAQRLACGAFTAALIVLQVQRA
jgi:hypothetical protein